MSKGEYAKYIKALEPTGIKHPKYGTMQREPLMYNGKDDLPEGPDLQVSCQLMLESGCGWGLGYTIEHPGGTITDFPHSHDEDEIWLFLGTNPNDNKDLGGEIEFWMGEGDEAEKYIITKPSAVLVPAGVVHCPVVFNKIKRPIISLPMLFDRKYKSNYTELPATFKRSK
jgi:hypothetical protein